MGKRLKVDRWTGSGWEELEATLRPRLGEVELCQMESWKPQLRALGEEDRDWDWRRLMAESQREHGESVEAAALILGGRVQAAILFWPTEQGSRLDGGPLIYVDRVATAPSNLDRTLHRGRIRGSGLAMMKYVRERSRRLGCRGRIGLHSLSKSKGFYLKLGMRELEPIIGDDEGFPYFEWPAEELR